MIMSARVEVKEDLNFVRNPHGGDKGPELAPSDNAGKVIDCSEVKAARTRGFGLGVKINVNFNHSLCVFVAHSGT